MALLWVCVIAALFMAGGCLVEFVARRRERRGFNLNAGCKRDRSWAPDDERLRVLPATLRQLLNGGRSGTSATARWTTAVSNTWC